MAGMEGLRTHPVRLGCTRGDLPQLHGVPVAPVEPLDDAGVHVCSQRVLVSLPHEDRRVVPPAELRSPTRQDVEYLVGLDSLLAEPAPVQDLGALIVDVRREECLHCGYLITKRYSMTPCSAMCFFRTISWNRRR